MAYHLSAIIAQFSSIYNAIIRQYLQCAYQGTAIILVIIIIQLVIIVIIIKIIMISNNNIQCVILIKNRYYNNLNTVGRK